MPDTCPLCDALLDDAKRIYLCGELAVFAKPKADVVKQGAYGIDACNSCFHRVRKQELASRIAGTISGLLIVAICVLALGGYDWFPARLVAIAILACGITGLCANVACRLYLARARIDARSLIESGLPDVEIISCDRAGRSFLIPRSYIPNRYTLVNKGT